jgi:hypothetical protein
MNLEHYIAIYIAGALLAPVILGALHAEAKPDELTCACAFWPVCLAILLICALGELGKRLGPKADK